MKSYNPEYKAALDLFLLNIPGVKAGKAFGYPAYKINGKVFAFVVGDGVTIKLPAERVQALVAAHDMMSPFEPTEGIVWREWVMIDERDAPAYQQHEAYFVESVEFVAG